MCNILTMVILKVSVCMCMHIHNVFASKGLISGAVLLLVTDSP